MSKELLFKKGYHLEITSWENDGDNYRTKTIFVGTDELTAKSLLKMSKELFSTYHDGKKIGIGNMMDDDYKKAGEKAQQYIQENPDVVEALTKFYECEEIDINDADTIYDIVVADFNSQVFGNSEYYIARVFDKGRVIFSPEDTYIEVIISENRR